MSIADNITRLTNIRNQLRTKLAAMGLVDSAAKFEAIAAAVDSIKDNGAVSASVKEGGSYTIPAGYHNGSGVVSGVPGGGNYNLEESKTVTPTKSQQNITPGEGFYGLQGVTVLPIPGEFQDVSDVTATAADTLAGKVIVDAEGVVTPGTMVNHGAASGTIDGLTVTSYTIPKGYHNGEGTVTLTKDIEEALAAL